MVKEAQKQRSSLHKARDEQAKTNMTFWEGSAGPMQEQPDLSDSGILRMTTVYVTMHK